MDSPLILDGATRFGRGLEMDRDFPGFPFDDDGGFGRRGDIRSHLDSLAARHPEFADHLIGPPWADIPFGAGHTGSLQRNRNRRSSVERPHNHSDEDTRSQASGASTASGASAASSHNSEPEHVQIINGPHQQPHQQQKPSMENAQQRNVRAMSAPPDNRQNNVQTDANGPYVSRVNFTPHTHNQQAHPQSQPQSQPQQPANGQCEMPQQTQQQQPQPQPPNQSSQQAHHQGGNVRHIPIFVEGRDTPVVPKDVDETDFQPRRREQSPPQFHRPSHYQQHYKHPPGWNFQDPFFDQPRWGSPPQHTPFQNRFAQEKPHAQQNWHNETQHQPNQRHHQSQPQPQSQHQPHPHPQQHQSQPQQEEQPEPPKPRQQVQPKDPLEKVAVIQEEINSLAEQVKNYKGNSRKDKEYIYLDEMLTRELIKLDDIETEGKDNVRQARKQAIRTIQETISLLESKAPLPGQQQNENVNVGEEKKEESMNALNSSEKKDEPMETNDVQTAVGETVVAEEKPAAIPLPAPETPNKSSLEALSNQPEQSEDKPSTPTKSENSDEKQETQRVQTEISSTQEANAKVEEKPSVAAESLDNSNNHMAATSESKEVRQPSPAKELVTIKETEKSKAAEETKENNLEAAGKNVEVTPKNETKVTKAKKEADKPSKSPKKAKKTKKQPEPVSKTAIPMPAP